MTQDDVVLAAKLLVGKSQSIQFGLCQSPVLETVALLLGHQSGAAKTHDWKPGK
jgi:hypothetical protein